MPFVPRRDFPVIAVSALHALPTAAHAPGGEADHAGFTFWSTEPWIVAGFLLALVLYAGGSLRLWKRSRQGCDRLRRSAAWFLSGMAVLAAALLSPIDTLGAELFSMHMIQHELMMLVAAPLIVAGKPLAVFMWGFPSGTRRRLGTWINSGAVRSGWRFLHAPLMAWSLHAVILWAWHFPAWFQASLASDAVHALQHFSFLASALLFWSSLFASRAQIHQGGAVLYVLSTAIHTGILGALLTFSQRIWYPAYLHTTDHWGLTPLEDQQLGGLIMWVPAGFIFIAAGMFFAAMAIWPEQRQWTK
jgi:putative membrane protein